MDSKIHVPTYDGKQKNFEKGKENFESYCYTRGCGSCLVENGEANLPTAMIGNFSTDKDIEKLEKESVNRNTKAMALLIMTLTTPTCRVIIHTSKIANLDWPTGLAWDVIE